MSKDNLKKYKPLIHWIGGKRQIIPIMDQYVPKNYNNYFEPFFGGGALFFHQINQGAHIFERNFYLSDINESLYDMWNVFVNRDKYNHMVSYLKEMFDNNNQEHYYKIRALDREPLFTVNYNPSYRVARTLYLSRSSFCGMFRVNSKGYFNISFGSKKGPINFSDWDNFNRVNELLMEGKKEGIFHYALGDYKTYLDKAMKGDFVYLDPPYLKAKYTNTDSVKYQKGSFGIDEHRELLKTFKDLTNRGVYVMLSNAYNDWVLDNYKSFKVVPIKASRVLNSNINDRGKKHYNEVLIMNYDIEEKS